MLHRTQQRARTYFFAALVVVATTPDTARHTARHTAQRFLSKSLTVG